MDSIVTVNGDAYVVDEESRKILAAAEAHLRAQGMRTWDDEDLALACEAVIAKLGGDKRTSVTLPVFA